MNAVLRREGNGIAPLSSSRQKVVHELKDLAWYSDDELFASLAVKNRDELEEIALDLSGGRGLSMPKEELSLSTFGSSRIPGHPGQYPKVYRFTEKSSFDTDSLVAYHVNRCDEDLQEVDEFMQVLSGSANWFFLIEGSTALCTFPALTSIYYHGLNPHGGYFNASTRAVVLAQIVGPSGWTMDYTNDANPIFEAIKDAGG